MINFIQKLRNKLDQLIYGYEPTLFMPVRRDTKLENKGEFVLYKINRAYAKMVMLLAIAHPSPGK